MNLTLHQFFKEFRYLWPRWLVFLLAVGFDLALQMQWLFPFKADSNLMLRSFVLSLPMWITAAWLMLSVPPEDMDGAFRGTRPLSRRDYWLARIMTGLVLVMLPLLVENAAFLMMSGRGWADVRSGMLETGLAGLVLLLWVLPAGTLFRGWEKYVALLLFFYGCNDTLSSTIIEWLGIAHLPSIALLLWCDFSVMCLSCICLVPLLIVIACWHQRRPFSRLMRLGLPVLMGLMLAVLTRSMVIPSFLEKPQAQAFVDQLVKDRQPVIMAGDIQVSSVEHLGEMHLQLKTQVRLDGIPPEIVPHRHIARSKLTQKGRELLDLTKPKLETKAPLWELNNISFHQSLAPHLPSTWPQGTLAVMEQSDDQLPLVKLDPKTDTQAPITLELDLAADWMRLRELGRMSLKAGASIRTPDSEIEVQEVIVGADTRGYKNPKIVTLRLRERHTTFVGRNGIFPISPRLCLLGKDKRLLWQQVMDGSHEERGANHGWVTIQRTITFMAEVLSPGTGVTAENLAEQELVWIGGEYLGTSRHEVKVENFVLDEHMFKSDTWPHDQGASEGENPREGFLNHVYGIPRPQKGAGKVAASYYVAAVCSASMAFRGRHQKDRFDQPLWPGSDKEVAALLAPILIEHPEIITAVATRMPFSEGSFTRHILSEVLLEAKIPGFSKGRSVDGIYPRYFMRVGGASAQGGENYIFRDPWISPLEQDWHKVSEAMIQALKTNSDEPMRPLMEFEKITSESIWRQISHLPQIYLEPWNLKRLIADPVYKEKAMAAVEHNYRELPRVALLDSDTPFRIFACKAVQGDAEALDYALRIFALLDEEKPLFAGSIDSFHRGVFGSKLERTETASFIQNCRRWTINDFRYDAVKMQWELKTNTKP
jgi:hypothetical protein